MVSLDSDEEEHDDKEELQGPFVGPHSNNQGTLNFDFENEDGQATLQNVLKRLGGRWYASPMLCNTKEPHVMGLYRAHYGGAHLQTNYKYSVTGESSNNGFFVNQQVEESLIGISLSKSTPAVKQSPLSLTQRSKKHNRKKELIAEERKLQAATFCQLYTNWLLGG
ncbi:hypothetical protein Tco_1415241 [Tanacetum coccineum]